MKNFLSLIFAFLTFGTCIAQWTDNGNVLSTSDDLEVDGNITISNGSYYKSFRSDGTTEHETFGMDGNNDIIFNRSAIVGKQTSRLTFASTKSFDFRDKNNNNLVRISSTGNVGIGTSSPESRLSVKGKIESEEVQVKQNVADYVFSADYRIISLEDLEDYITENGHLPRIQTQDDVDSNRGLVNLGELTISLMEKIEEMTIYTIDLNKRLKFLESKNKELESRID